MPARKRIEVNTWQAAEERAGGTLRGWLQAAAAAALPEAGAQAGMPVQAGERACTPAARSAFGSVFGRGAAMRGTQQSGRQPLAETQTQNCLKLLVVELAGQG